jgi:hypothetical protein
MKNIEVIDNFLSIRHHTQLFDSLCNPEAPVHKKMRWEFTNVLPNSMVDESDRKYNFMFTTAFKLTERANSVEFDPLHPLLLRLNVLFLFRVKANLYYREDKIAPHGFHTDIGMYPENVREKIKTAVYFVNTNNGKIMFEDGTQIDSVANRVVIFPMMTQHCGTSCTDQPYRCVVNINYFGLDI